MPIAVPQRSSAWPGAARRWTARRPWHRASRPGRCSTHWAEGGAFPARRCRARPAYGANIRPYGAAAPPPRARWDAGRSRSTIHMSSPPSLAWLRSSFAPRRQAGNGGTAGRAPPRYSAGATAPRPEEKRRASPSKARYSTGVTNSVSALADDQPAHHGEAERLAQLCRRAPARGDREGAGAGRQRRHHDGAEAQQAGIAHRLEHRLAGALPRQRDIDDHDGVLLDQPDQQQHAEITAMTERSSPNSRSVAKAPSAAAGRPERMVQRMDQALIEHASTT